MRKRRVGVPSGMFVGFLLVMNVAIGQDEVQAPAHLNFEQFSTVVRADEVSFLTTLKWAGMILVNAPAADRVVTLYEYEAGSMGLGDCSESGYSSDHALLVNWAIPATAMIAALEEAGVSLDSEQWDLSRGAPQALGDGEWVTVGTLVATLDSHNIDEGYWSEVFPEPSPVWHELPFASSCGLQETVATLDDSALVWQPVLDQKLKAIARFPDIVDGGAAGALPPISPRVFVTRALEGPVETAQYFAECLEAEFVQGAWTATPASVCNRKSN